MALLPSSKNLNTSATSILNEIKKGGDEKRNEFVYLNLERVYAIAYIASDNQEHAQELTIEAFRNALSSLQDNIPKKDSGITIWQWLADFVVDACVEYHAQNSGIPEDNPNIDPGQDGSASMDWETTVLLGVQRIKRCMSSLPPEQQKAFHLRHSLDLNYEQIAAVMNQSVEMSMAALYRGRVSIIKCLGKG